MDDKRIKSKDKLWYQTGIKFIQLQRYLTVNYINTCWQQLFNNEVTAKTDGLKLTDNRYCNESQTN